MRTVYSFRNLLQHRAICKSDGIAVEIDRVVVGKAVDRAVTGQIPDAVELSSVDATASVVSLSILVDVLVVLLHAVMVSTRAAAQINDKFLFFIIKIPFKYNLLVF